MGGPPAGVLLACVVFTRNSGKRKTGVLNRSASLPPTHHHNPSASHLSVPDGTVATCPAPHFPGSWGNNWYIFASRDRCIFVLVCNPLHLAHHLNTFGCPAPPTNNPPLSSRLQSTMEPPPNHPTSDQLSSSAFVLPPISAVAHRIGLAII